MAASDRQPDVRVAVHGLFGEPRELTLSYPLSAEHDELLAEIRHRPSGRRKIVQDLTCAPLRTEPIWLVVRNIPDPRRGSGARRWSLAHWPGSGLEDRAPHVVSQMSDEHKQQAQIIARIAHDNGHTAQLERSVAPGTRSDVAIYGPDGNPVATGEVQLCRGDEPNIIRRDAAPLRRGITPFWIGANDAQPTWWRRVGWVGANRVEHERPGGWTAARGQAVLEPERCTPSSRLECPDRRPGRTWCGGWHPLWEPRGGTVDDFVSRVLSRDLVRADVGNRIVFATPADVGKWADMLGADPAVAAARTATAARDAELRNGKPVLHRARQSDPQPAPLRALPTCGRCGKPTWRATPGPCAGCRMAPPPPAPPPPSRAPSHCRKCGYRLTAVYPGQQYHPTCDPAPVTLSRQIAEGRI